jgi:hypothetical protein
LQIRLIPQRIDLSPEDWHASSDLNKAHLGAEIIKDTLTRRLLIFDKHQLLRFVEICNVALVIEASSEITSTCAMARPPAD